MVHAWHHNRVGVCVCVCVCVCTAMRFVALWGTELKVRMGVGVRPMRFVDVFSKQQRYGQRSSREIDVTYKSPMTAKFGWKNPWPECSPLLGSKVTQVSSGVTQRSNCLAMGYQIWSEALPNAGVKDHIAVMRGPPEIWLLKNILWPPNLIKRTPDQRGTQWWGQRSYRGHAEGTRGQIARSSLWPPLSSKSYG